MNKKISISKIKFVIGDKELELAPDEAIALKDLLNETLGNDKTVIVPQPYPFIPKPLRPYLIYPYWEIWTSGTMTSGNTNAVTYTLM